MWKNGIKYLLLKKCNIKMWILSTVSWQLSTFDDSFGHVTEFFSSKCGQWLNSNLNYSINKNLINNENNDSKI
jgi:hypothetical protein